ncbi:hypothetical protein ACQQ6Y_06375 [Corynebacterium diphtheriae]|uniref:hypothetical protein n=1 Tax=Corynebacterium diphtheriae TaxID=1717 RepID=UPI0008937064|nr:hypothetical protein [Corynebacterium diphtheriae]OFI53889.1 hypothetical protein BKD83_01620 [Corynebacterium diphtheriae]OSQ21399.1 hypothetical protein B1A52_04355 [Corynebacterium diphtheriae]CAB0580911.1 hypothetical protein CIP107559_00260 [Corynebacterium diphtheriae]CAB0581740.1 hypothetical protein CIP107552_00297 [Corynebacterium diphtheriae]
MILLVLMNLLFCIMLMFGLTDLSRKFDNIAARSDMDGRDLDRHERWIMDLYDLAKVPPLEVEDDEEAYTDVQAA